VQEKDEGKMKSLFNLNNPIFRFLGRVLDIAYLNILCLICCVPVITIGPSVTALYYSLLKIARGKESPIASMFFSSFKTNLKQGALLTALFAGFAILLITDIRAYNITDKANAAYIKTALYVVFALFAVVVSYTFPLLAQFDNTVMNILKYSVLLAICNFKYTFWVVLLNAIPVTVFIFLPELFLWTFPAWLTFGFAAIAAVNSRMFVKIFDKFVPESQEGKPC